MHDLSVNSDYFLQYLATILKIFPDKTLQLSPRFVDDDELHQRHWIQTAQSITSERTAEICKSCRQQDVSYVQQSFAVSITKHLAFEQNVEAESVG